jgi:cation diffusion facilitator CzcD-associated flavoprotein CzcO
MAMPNRTGTSWYHKVLPAQWSFKVNRFLFALRSAVLFHLCRAFPDAAKSRLIQAVAAQLPAHVPVDPHFTPLYNPWDQRLCLSPNGDFFEAIREDRADVVTDSIATMNSDAIVLASGRELKADIIITATGLKMRIGGNIHLTVDGKPVDLSEKVAWRVSMFSDVPNLAFMAGYVNASWTLGADVNAHILCRLLHHMRKKGLTSATPRVPGGLQLRPMWALDSTYMREGNKSMPSCGDSGPWLRRSNYFLDMWRAKFGSITADLEFSSGGG